MRKKAGKQGIAGVGVVVPSSKWEMNEWQLQPQSPAQTQTEPWDFAHPNPHHNDSNPHSQSRGDFPLWESKLLFLGVFVIFFWQVIFIHRLQEPDVGLRDCAAPASCFPADSRSTCPARSWTQPGEPGNCARSAQPGEGTNREKPPWSCTGGTAPRNCAVHGTEQQIRSWIFGS